MSHNIRSSAKVSFYIMLCTQLRKASPEQAAEELANITSLEIQADDVSLAADIIEDLSEDATTNERVCVWLYSIIYACR